ncbi:hypothetical protein McanMca71_001224 [Microsporum canis]
MSLDTPPTESSMPSDTNRPPFWTPNDRPGRNGIRDRYMRKRRLANSICLNAAELRDVLLFIYENGDSELNIKWTEEFVFRFVPRTFEGAIVPKGVAGSILEGSVTNSCAEIFPSAHSGSLSSTGPPKYQVFEVYWDGDEPVVPPELQGLPNLALIHKGPDNIKLENMQI